METTFGRSFGSLFAILLAKPSNFRCHTDVLKIYFKACLKTSPRDFIILYTIPICKNLCSMNSWLTKLKAFCKSTNAEDVSRSYSFLTLTRSHKANIWYRLDLLGLRAFCASVNHLLFSKKPTTPPANTPVSNLLMTGNRLIPM